MKLGETDCKDRKFMELVPDHVHAVIILVFVWRKNTTGRTQAGSKTGYLPNTSQKLYR
jgi:hypothetical protein